MRLAPRLVAARTASARRVLSALSLVTALGLAGAFPGPVANAADASIVLDGHGNGHGVGLSQWGAYGYAVDLGWTSAQIVDHYFGNTVAGTVPLDTPIRVRLQNLDNGQTAVAVDDGELVVDGLAGGPWKSVLVRETATNGVFAVWARADTSRCPASSGDPVAGGWTLVNGAVTGDVDVHTAVDSTTVTSPSQMISTCEPSLTVRWYRGTIRATNDGFGANRTLNVLPVEQYLRTVIAMEMSPGWADDGGGRGAQALQAQAIAARSYALAYRAATPSYTYADLCDMVCQSYFGVAFRTGYGTSNSAFRQVENAATDAAVVATAGVVRRVTATNAIALAMFSASNGGWTATNNHPLTPFPAVQDDGDGTALNPKHSWSVTVSGATIALKYPSIGTFTGLSVNARNGYGEWGGRVLSLTVTGTAASITVSGADFRSKLGLSDTWFTVRGATVPPAATDCGTRVTPAVTGTLPVPKGTLFSPIAPVRLVDTRTGVGTEATPLGAGCTMVVATGRNPASVRAVVVDLTALKPATAGSVVAYACGTAPPAFATMRLAANRSTSTTAVVPLGADGTICISSSVTVPMLVDLFGAYSTMGKYRFEPVSPARLYDSRPTGVRVKSGTTLKVKVAGTTRVPLGAAGAAFTVHATGATADGYLVVTACTATRPAVTSMNVNAGIDATNHVETAISTTGQVCIFVGGSSMHVTVDLTGWFGTKATTRLFVVAPARVVDTSKNVGLVGGFAAGQNRAVTLAGKAGMPAASTLRAVLANVAVTGASRTGWVTVHPCLSPVPSVSLVRFGAGAPAVAVAAGADDAKGRWCLSASTAVHVVVDVGGWYA